MRLLCGGLLFTCNAVMWTSFSKALRHCSSSARATVTTTASNFISSVSPLHPTHHALYSVQKDFSEFISILLSYTMSFLICVTRPSWGGWFLEKAIQFFGGWASLLLFVACLCFMDPHLRSSYQRRAKSTHNVHLSHSNDGNCGQTDIHRMLHCWHSLWCQSATNSANSSIFGEETLFTESDL